MSALEDIDRRLAAWAEWLARVDDSLLALEAEPTYQILAGTVGARAPLEGISHARVSPALDALADLFEHRQRLEAVFVRAKELRASITALGFLQNDDRVRQIRALLEGPSVRLETRRKPLAQRGLLDAAAEDVLVSPEDLLLAMQQAYEGARDAVLAVQRAWATLEPTLGRMEAELAALGPMAEAIGAAKEAKEVARERSAIAGELAVAHARIARDPLGATDIESTLARRISALRGTLSALAGQKERVEAGLATAAAHRRELAETHVRARAVQRSAVAELADARLPALVSDDALDGLDAWREKLEQTAAARRWSSVAIGLARWEEACATYLAIARSVLFAADALAAKKDELRGRLSARTAQLHALEKRGLPRDAELHAVAARAEALLARRPLDLAALEVSVAAFETGVVDAARRAK